METEKKMTTKLSEQSSKCLQVEWLLLIFSLNENKQYIKWI